MEITCGSSWRMAFSSMSAGSQWYSTPISFSSSWRVNDCVCSVVGYVEACSVMQVILLAYVMHTSAYVSIYGAADRFFNVMRLALLGNAHLVQEKLMMGAGLCMCVCASEYTCIKSLHIFFHGCGLLFFHGCGLTLEPSITLTPDGFVHLTVAAGWDWGYRRACFKR